MSTSELRANCMASDNRKPELEDAPLSFKSQVWENFGFQVNYHNGERRVDKSKAVCRHCSTAIVYANGNTSNMHKIFAPGTILTWQHHPGVTVTAAKWKKVVQTVQTQLPTLFNQPLHLSGNSERANAITRSTGVFIASDLREAMKTPIDYKILKLWFKLRLQLHFYWMIDIYIYENFRALESCRNIFFKPLKFTYSLFTYQLKEPRLSINTGFFINFMLGLLENCSSIFFIFVTHFICMFHTDS